MAAVRVIKGIDPAANTPGWFYHFVDIRSGARYRTSEVSTSDSTWLVAGALTARQYFEEDPQITRFATGIYERVDYRWMLNQHPFFLAHGWTPESGFLPPVQGFKWKYRQKRIPHFRPSRELMALVNGSGDRERTVKVEKC